MPRKKIFVKGDTVDSRFDSIERVLHRFSRRLGRFCAVYIPPFPVSGYVDTPDSDGVLFRYIFPLKGKVEKCLVFFGNAPDNHLVSVTFIREGITKMWDAEVGKETTIGLDIEVKPGDKFILSSYESILHGIWTCLSYQVAENEAEIKQIALDACDKEAAR